MYYALIAKEGYIFIYKLLQILRKTLGIYFSKIQNTLNSEMENLRQCKYSKIYYILVIKEIYRKLHNSRKGNVI